MSQELNRQLNQLAAELDDIRVIYGEECVAMVKAALRQSDGDWHDVVDATVRSFERRRAAYGYTAAL